MSDLESALDDCLNRMAKGETIEVCLARYPEHASELRRLLAAADALAPGRHVHPTPQFKGQGRARLVAHMRAHPRRQRRSPFAIFAGRGMRLALSLSAVLLVVLTLGTGAAQAALPGQPLYGWKIASEQLWRSFSPDRLGIDLELARRRAEELERIAGDSQAEPIAREGYARALDELSQYTDSTSRERIGAALTEQQAALQAHGLAVPQLDELLAAVRPSSGPSATAPAATHTQVILPSLAHTPAASAEPTLEQPPAVTLPAPTLPVPPAPGLTHAPTSLPPVVSTVVAPPAETVISPALTNLPTLPLP